MKKQQVSLTKEMLVTALELMWKRNAKQQAAGAYRAQDYVTGTDLEAAVRALARAALDGKTPDGVIDDLFYGYSYGIRVHTGGAGSLLDVCRDYLLSEVRAGRLVSHNFGRGHISGARYRPAGTPAMNETEKKTLAAKIARRSKPRPIHYSLTYGRAICIPKKSGFSCHRSTARTDSDWEHVTCPRCIKLMKGA